MIDSAEYQQLNDSSLAVSIFGYAELAVLIFERKGRADGNMY